MEMNEAMQAENYELALEKAESLTDDDKITALDKLSRQEMEQESGAAKATEHLQRLEQLLGDNIPEDRAEKHTTQIAIAYVQLRRGAALKTLEDFEGALRAYEQGIKSLSVIAQRDDEQSELADAHYVAGQLHSELGDWASAKHEFQLASAGFTSCKGANSLEAIESRHQVAATLQEQKEDDEARATFKQVLVDADTLPAEHDAFKATLKLEFRQRFSRK